MQEISPAVFRDGTHLFTANLVLGTRVYGEKLVRHSSEELREWAPERSKLAAALTKGMREMPITKRSKVLYLGASTGTTISHISDIVGKDGIVYAVEFSERVFHPLLGLAKERKNIVPLLADARKPELYFWVEECDLVYCDVADPQQTALFVRNCGEFLKKDCHGLLAVKSQSIDVTKLPQQVYQEEARELKKEGFTITQIIDLEPYEQKHAMIVVRK